MTGRRPPSVAVLVGVWLAVVAVAVLTVGAATEPTSDTQADCNRISGLVLDGNGVTTTRPSSSAGRPTEPIPYRSIGDPVTTTTTGECG